MKKLLIILLVFFLLLSTGCSSQKQSVVFAAVKPPVEVNLKIVVTNKLIYYFVKDIVQDKGNVDYMFNNLDEEQNFKYTDDSTTNISQQDLFIYIGSGFEPWAQNFASKLDKSKVGVIDSSRGVKILQYSKPVMYENDLLKDNPYYWLNSDNYKMMMVNIKSAIEDKDPLNRAFYEDNFKNLGLDIDLYQKEMKTICDKLKDNTFVTDNDNYDYFLKSFGLKVIKIDYESLSKDPDSIIKLDGELSKLKDLTFIYSEDSQVTKSQVYINKYFMKKVKLYVYDDYFKYSDLMWANISNIKRLIKDIKTN